MNHKKIFHNSKHYLWNIQWYLTCKTVRLSHKISHNRKHYLCNIQYPTIGMIFAISHYCKHYLCNIQYPTCKTGLGLLSKEWRRGANCLAILNNIHDTWYLSFFLHGQHFSPHRNCAYRYKTGFAAKQCKLQQNWFCDKAAKIWY